MAFTIRQAKYIIGKQLTHDTMIKHLEKVGNHEIDKERAEQLVSRLTFRQFHQLVWGDLNFQDYGYYTCKLQLTRLLQKNSVAYDRVNQLPTETQVLKIGVRKEWWEYDILSIREIQPGEDISGYTEIWDKLM